MITLIGIERPRLKALLAARGIATGDGGRVILAGEECVQAGPAVAIEAAGMAGVTAALDAGAGEAVLRSDPDQLVAARLAALLRRCEAAPVHVGDLLIDPVGRRVTRAGRVIPLLPREYALLVALARAAGRTVGRAALREAVWGREFDPGTNVIEVHVSRLRAKLHGSGPPMLLTDKGRGYRLVPAPVARAVAAG